MNNFRKFWAAAFFIAASRSIPSQVFAQGQDDSIDARIASADGDVTVYCHDQGDKGVPADKDMPLAVGDKIVTGADSRAEIGLDGASMMELDSNSEFIVNSLDSKSSVFILGLGSLLAKIKSLVSTGGQMQIITPTAVAAVRGTEFGVAAAKNGTSRVGVFDEGYVSVVGQGGAGSEVTLVPNQETSIDQGRNPEAAHPLQQFLGRRARMARIRTRLTALRRTWKTLTPEQRRKAREKMLKRRLRLMRPIRERRKRLKDDGRDRRRRRRER